MHGPCNLVAAGSCCDGWDEASQEDKDRASALAAHFIWVASGRQYGVCQETVRPCGDDCNDYSTYWGPSQASMWIPTLTAEGTWINCRTGSCRCNTCDSCNVCGVKLCGPVDSITTVLLDGVVVDPSEYFVYDESLLVRRNGCFPTSQDLTLPPTEVGTFEVTYGQGKPLGAAGQAALDALACEFLKLCTGGKCRLPSRWTSLSREGISMQSFDDFSTLTKGRIGIFEVDSWLTMVNPGGNLYPNYIPHMDEGSRLFRVT